MGQLFQRTYKAKDGTIKTCDTWTIRYFRGGRAHQEPTKFTRKGDAERLLKTREGDIFLTFRQNAFGKCERQGHDVILSRGSAPALLLSCAARAGNYIATVIQRIE